MKSQADWDITKHGPFVSMATSEGWLLMCGHHMWCVESGGKQQLGMEGLNRWKCVRVHNIAHVYPRGAVEKKCSAIPFSFFFSSRSITEASEIAPPGSGQWLESEQRAQQLSILMSARGAKSERKREKSDL